MGEDAAAVGSLTADAPMPAPHASILLDPAVVTEAVSRW
jgi:hypothetical protein